MTIKFDTPKKILATVLEKNKLNDVDLEIIFETRENVSFLPGQFISVNCGNGMYRSYSISSSSMDKNKVGLIAAVGHEGVGSNYLKNISIGDITELVGPSGRFVLPEVLKENIVFIATGTGIAPVLSMIDYLMNTKYEGKVELYFGIRNTKELFKEDLLKTFKNTMKNFSYTLCFSQEENPNTTSPWKKGRVTEIFQIGDINNTQYFLCGNPYMVLDMAKVLTDKGVSEQDIYNEKFTVSKKTA
jgi:ferredoxin-NADP reductase